MQGIKVYDINEFISLRFENNKTNIYVKGDRFIQCIRLVLQIPSMKVELYDQINSIDEAVDVYDKHIYRNEVVQGPMARPRPDIHHTITPETEFWGHCSNLEAWVDCGYDTRVLHRNLAFPLLKWLTDVGDPQAKKVFKEEIARRFLSGHESVVTYLTEQGYLTYFNKEEFETLISLANVDFKATPKMWDNIGNVKFFRREYDGAIEAFRNALELDPSFDITWDLLGQAYYHKKEFKSAIRSLKEELIIHTNHGDTWYVLGKCYFELDQYEHASKAYKNALRTEHHSYGMYYSLIEDFNELIIRYLNLSLLRKAKRDLNFILYYRSNAKSSRLLLGLIHLLNGKYIDALETYREALEKDPTKSWNWISEDFLTREEDRVIEYVLKQSKFIHPFNQIYWRYVNYKNNYDFYINEDFELLEALKDDKVERTYDFFMENTKTIRRLKKRLTQLGGKRKELINP